MPAKDATLARVEGILYLGLAEAYGFHPAEEAPCSLCRCSSPAAELAECDRPDCPLEGAGRDEG